jgi:parvulin-like peptidyl-prolyl isomerase
MVAFKERISTMNRKIILSLVLLFTGSFLYAQAIDKPAATVKLTKPLTITVKQLRKYVDPLEQRANRTLTLEEREKLLNSLIDKALIEQAAERDKIVISDAELKAGMDDQKKNASVSLGRDISDQDFQTIVAGQGMTMDDYTAVIKYSLLTQKYASLKNKDAFANVPQPTDTDARAYYDTNKTKPFTTGGFVWDDSLHLRWILIDTRNLSKDEKDKAAKRADGAYRELMSGAKFEDMVTKYSDDTSSKYKGGDIMWVLRSSDAQKQLLGQDFFNAIFTLKKGETSAALTSNVGFAIVQVTERIDAKLLGFDEMVPPQYTMSVKDYIKKSLYLQKQGDTFNKVLSDILAALRKEAEIKLFPENLGW